MAAEKEIRVRSFRIDDQTAEKFKQIANQLGGNQQQTMVKLIEAYELQGSMTALPEYKADIEMFEGLTTRLSQMYLSMLQANQEISQNIKAQYAEQINAKDRRINMLVSRLDSAQKAAAETTEEKCALQAEYVDYKDRTTARLQDANRTVKATQQSVNLMQSEIERLKKELEKAKTDQTELEKLKADNADLRRQLGQANLEKEKAIFAERKKAQQEIDKYQQQIFALMAKK